MKSTYSIAVSLQDSQGNTWLFAFLRRRCTVGRESANHLKARCPECLAAIWLKDTVELWDPVTCHECHTPLEVVKLRPPTLDYMGDWDEEEEDLYDNEEADW
jgi:lysine biosynthesis protein LysW